jgi:hypothetical protein
MPESGLSGSVRGVLSNEHPYRDPRPKGDVHRASNIKNYDEGEDAQKIGCFESDLALV